MLNLHSPHYIHMTPARYQRILALIETLAAAPAGRSYFVEELYGFLSPEDSDPPSRRVMIAWLRRSGLIVRRGGRPIQYRLQTNRFEPAARKLRAVLDLTQINSPPQLVVAR